MNYNYFFVSVLFFVIFSQIDIAFFGTSQYAICYLLYIYFCGGQVKRIPKKENYFAVGIIIAIAHNYCRAIAQPVMPTIARLI